MFQNPIRPVKCTFGVDIDNSVKNFVHERIESIQNATRTLRETDVPEWRRLLQGKPSEEKKSFPWENASNVVIQISGTCQDILKAAIMGSIWGVLPIYNAALVGEWEENEKGEDQRNALEEAMVYFASEPEELDLYRVENLWFGEGIGFGSSFTKTPYEYLTETQIVGLSSIDGGDSAGEKLQEQEFVRKYGPSPEKLPFEDFLVEPTASTLYLADFKCHIRHFKKWDLEDRRYKGIYEKKSIDAIIGQPDRHGPATVQQQAQQDMGITLSSMSIQATWDVYECWFKYNHPNGKTYSLLYTYHFKSKTVLKCVFNFYPDNDDPFDMCRLGWDDDGIYGMGFAKMLKHYQEEVSTGHNQRVDNRTLGNTSILRTSRISKLDSNFSVYPLATIPGEKDEFEVMQLGTNYPPDIQGEQLTLSLAERRAGVEMGVQASGGGTTNPKKGVYSAMGTFAVMQAGNRRNNMRTADMRYAHIQLGRRILKLYSYFGLGDKGKVFGKKEAFLRQALQNVKQGRMTFPIRAATESVNKELEKQNLMLLVNVVKQHHMSIAQTLMQINQGKQMGALDDQTIKYLLDTIKAMDYLMQDLLRAFNMNDVARLLPLPDFIKGAMNVISGQQPNAGAGEATDAALRNNVQRINGGAGSGIPISSSGLPEVSGVPQ